MKSKACFLGLSLTWVAFLMTTCEQRPQHRSDFTRADSLTETYLAIQDTMLEVWNTMMHDDNRKIKTMHELLHELNAANPERSEELKQCEERLNALPEMRYDQHSMTNAEIVSEYDFVSNSLVTELISLAESQKQFPYNATLQRLVDSIRSADQRVMNYRAEYDEIATRFNRFIDNNRSMLDDLAADSFLEKKPLFQMAAE